MNEIDLKNIEKELRESSYGELKHKIERLTPGLWANLTSKGTRKKNVLIERCLIKLGELKNSLGDGFAHTGDGKPIKSQNEKDKYEFTPNEKPIDLTVNAQSQLLKTDLENPISENPISEKPIVSEKALKDLKKIVSEVSLSKRSLDPLKAKLEKENGISKKPETKIETAKPILATVSKTLLTKDVIEKNLISINANLKNNIAGQKSILLEKKKILMEMLERYS